MVKDPATGEILELHCTYDPESVGGSTPDGRRVRGTLHWVSAPHSREVDVRLYDYLLLDRDEGTEDDARDFISLLNPDSLQVLSGCRVEPSLGSAEAGARFQFERQGYFCVDAKDSRPGAPVFNRTVSLRDSWARIEQTQAVNGG